MNENDELTPQSIAEQILTLFPSRAEQIYLFYSIPADKFRYFGFNPEDVDLPEHVREVFNKESRAERVARHKINLRLKKEGKNT